VRIKCGQAFARGTSNAVRENHTVVTARRVTNTAFFKTLFTCLDIVNAPLLSFCVGCKSRLGGVDCKGVRTLVRFVSFPWLRRLGFKTIKTITRVLKSRCSCNCYVRRLRVAPLNLMLLLGNHITPATTHQQCDQLKNRTPPLIAPITFLPLMNFLRRNS